MRSLLLLVAMFLISLFSGCKQSVDLTKVSAEWKNDLFRPQYHFSPVDGWMNDPNGMVYFDGEYHLFYQYYPDSTVWGPMHWGHAISRDLVEWEHLPIALYPDSLGWIFSGSAVYDHQNTSGLGKNGVNPLVAIFTHHSAPQERSGSDLFQYQSIAFSLDKGRTWYKYKGNPVLENPGIRDFRDPKVFWHEPSKKWIMTLAALNKVIFYNSPDLINWTYLSEFGSDKGSHDGVWECPDLFPLLDEQGKEYWVLILNMNPGNPNGGSGTQYFIGHFDGKEFILDPGFEQLLAPLPAVIPEGELFADFEDDISSWSQEGTAFQTQALPAGKGKLLSSIVLNNAETGVLTSPSFVVSRPAINFRIAGGDHRGRTMIALEVEGRIVREAEGNRNEELVWKGWDVSTYRGKEARIKIVDRHEGDWGFIEVDDITFAEEVAHEKISGSVWLDAGADNYAGVTWSNVPDEDGRRIFIGWMSNWAYAQVVPTERWRSAMTLPWELAITRVEGIPRLKGRPIREVEKLRIDKWESSDLPGQMDLPEGGLAEVILAFSASKDFRLEIGNQAGEQISFDYQTEHRLFTFDRSLSGVVGFNPDFSKKHTVRRISDAETLSLHFYLDRSSIEIFLDGGLNIFTELYFSEKPMEYIRIEGKLSDQSEWYNLKKAI